MSRAQGDASHPPLGEAVAAVLRAVPDFPRPGILFRDITPLLADAALFVRCTNAMADLVAGTGVTHVAAIESRGFLFGAPIAQRLGVALVPLRKPGKLPYRPRRLDYALEYGSDALEIHPDACGGGAAVLVVDDVLATGGTMKACCDLVSKLGGEIAGVAVLSELMGLEGRKKIPYPIHSVVQYD
jgi:adenine phosphoribosyltransferase